MQACIRGSVTSAYGTTDNTTILKPGGEHLSGQGLSTCNSKHVLMLSSQLHITVHFKHLIVCL